MTITAERISAFISKAYVLPAREHGEDAVVIPARHVWKGLDGEFPLELIRGILGSMRFRNTYQLALVAEEGAPEHPPDTYVFKVLPSPALRQSRETDY